ncbi:YebC/PmpR family DNA-binding transcriptional regulator [Spectribacter hydrogenoxidans]|uniref:Probable transcriptional regulatory protein RM532_11885 n=1 Tax=Spectribacter hydrogenoxidans TaxID=3075608 RepID=A0ABU3C263_9GAMM|nr:YebC/PmpR family DNA-binding transcriptional regulator [Salinisphaera sp. W335]MDT0635651.1 YebC/PmpR family DNA-binding transcriptional regulator [Salinisphaera sp. W335]
MAGHSKWANIQYRKGAQDKKRGKIFTKLIREISVSARTGGGDPDANPRLRLAIDKALSNNMPKDNIERAIKRATGDADGAHYEEVRYEGYGPGGVAIMVDCLTDNKNRTVAEVRHAFSKHGGNLGADGSVAYLFSRAGVISYGPEVDDEPVLAVALEAGAEDIAEYDDGSFDVLTAPDDYRQVRDALAAAGHEPSAADVTMRPATTTELEGGDAETCLKLLDMLEDLDDVQNVYSNVELPEDVLAAG